MTSEYRSSAPPRLQVRGWFPLCSVVLPLVEAWGPYCVCNRAVGSISKTQHSGSSRNCKSTAILNQLNSCTSSERNAQLSKARNALKTSNGSLYDRLRPSLAPGVISHFEDKERRNVTHWCPSYRPVGNRYSTTRKEILTSWIEHNININDNTDIMNDH